MAYQSDGGSGTGASKVNSKDELLLVAGEKLGSYRIDSLIGKGGMGEVYLASDERLQRFVAIKRIRLERAFDGEHRERFRREALAVAQLSHPAIVQVFEWLDTPFGNCLVMEWIRGRNLAEAIAAGELDLRRTLRIAYEVAEGLAEAHSKGLIHRDLKPENVLMTASGHAKIVDFGLVAGKRQADADSDTALTRSGVLVGTFHAMSPEQAGGFDLDHRSDLFSFGCILYEMLTGRSPFRAEHWMDTLRRVVGEAPEPLGDLRPDLAPALIQLVESLLAKDPEGRPANAWAVCEALESILLGAPETGAAPAGGKLLSQPASASAVLHLTADWPEVTEDEFRVETVMRTLLRVVPLDGGSKSSGWEDTAYFEAMARCIRRLREQVSSHGGIEVEKGDAFLALFERPTSAVACALAHQLAVAELVAACGQPLASGAVVHFGEVVLRRSTPQEIARGARPLEVEGGAKSLAARVGGLLAAGQILLTRAAFDLARRGVSGAGSEPDPGDLRWLAHGIYLFDGGDEEPVEIFEVGIEGRSPLAAPEGSARMRRVLAPNEEKMLGWRPAKEQQIPFRPSWTLLERMGEGGFGEVWLARHASDERRVFKFCWDAGRLRALKREVALLGILKDALGNREDIARIFDWQFEQAPYFLELEYSDGGSLVSWAENQGGLTRLPLADRLELGAQVAEALGAAHSVGILHKDIKPDNVLVVRGADGRWKTKLADFGLGRVTASELVDVRGVNPFGFSFAFSEADSGAGTMGYLAPELVEGKTATVQADIYSLGVLVYQLVVGDFKRALAPGWERRVADPLLREDLASFVDGQPENRPASAREVATRLRTLEERRARLREERELEETAKAQQLALVAALRRRRWATGLAAAAMVVLALVGILALRTARAGAEAQLEAQKSEAVAGFLVDTFGSIDPLEGLGGKVSARDLLDLGAGRIEELAGQPEVQARLMDAMGRAYWTLGAYDVALDLAQKALAIRLKLLGPDHLETARSRHLLGQVQCSLQQPETGIAQMTEALEISRRFPEYRGLFDDLLATSFCVHVLRGDPQAASRLLQEALDLTPKFHLPAQKILDLEQRFALLKAELGQVDEGVAMLREALRESRRRGQRPLACAIMEANLAALEWTAGNREEAISVAASSSTVLENELGPDHAWVWVAKTTRALALHSLGKVEEARLIFEAALARDQRTQDQSLIAVNTLAGIAWSLHDRGACEKAEIYLREALKICQQQQQDLDDFPAAFVRSIQASCLAREGKNREALALFRRTVPMLERRWPKLPQTIAASKWMSSLEGAYGDQEIK